MIVFKTYWRIIKQYWWIIILYVSMLTAISLINFSATPTTDFIDTKPQITVINHANVDPLSTPLTNNFLSYLAKHAELVNLPESKITDALFYQETSLVLFLPSDLESQILSAQKITLDYRTSGDYTAELAKNLVTRYFELQRAELSAIKQSSLAQKHPQDLAPLISSLNQKLALSPTVHLSTQNAPNLKKTSSFFNFTSYTIMAIILYITCFINASFNKAPVKKRTLVSGFPLKKYNLSLLFTNSIFAFFIFLLFSILSFFILGHLIFTPFLIFYLPNTFLLTICALTLAELISTINLSKEAISGVVNLLSLVPAFLSGAFVPATFLPQIVLNIAHLSPSYWFVDINNKIASFQNPDFHSLATLLPNFLMLIFFPIFFILLNLLLAKKKRVNI